MTFNSIYAVVLSVYGVLCSDAIDDLIVVRLVSSEPRKSPSRRTRRVSLHPVHGDSGSPCTGRKVKRGIALGALRWPHGGASQWK